MVSFLRDDGRWGREREWKGRNGGKLTKWLANSRPGTLAEAYSKSMTISCLCSFAGRSKGDSPLGVRRRRLPYWV